MEQPAHADSAAAGDSQPHADQAVPSAAAAVSIPLTGEHESPPHTHTHAHPPTDAPPHTDRTVRVAIWGCGHGELDRVYEALEALRARDPAGRGADLLLCCGDFQAVRNEGDLACMSAPDKYKAMRTFYKYYSGEKLAPVLTLFIGGNHEAANYMQELPYGGWVAPNIFYLGTSGIVNFRGLRIAGISGIFKRYNYREGYYEAPPYTSDTIKSVYHVREFDYFKLHHVQQPIDVFLSHDWPTGIYNYGNAAALVRAKRHFADEVQRNELGNPANAELLQHLQPRYWFSAHLHVKFAAVVQHSPRPGTAPRATRFLALDKCLPGRAYLQLADITPESSATMSGESAAQLCYDAEWLAILRRVHHLTPPSRRYPPLPAPVPVTADDIRAVHERCLVALGAPSSTPANTPLVIPNNFVITVFPYRPPYPGAENAPPVGLEMPWRQGNPQTDAFLAMLGLPHAITIPYLSEVGFASAETGPGVRNTLDYGSAPLESGGDAPMPTTARDPAEIDLDDGGNELDSCNVEANVHCEVDVAAPHDPAEIELE